MSLADYLAKNYLTADSPRQTEKKSKKRKRKAGTSTSESGLIIAEDDITGWEKKNDSGDEDAPTTVNSSTADFRKAKSSSWQSIGMPPPSHSDQAAADAIILSAAADTKARYAADEDEPPTTPTINKMESGAHAGLQTADQVAAQLSQSRAAEHARFLTDSSAHSGQNAETIYRDASGRIINVAMKRAEARQAAAAAAAKMKAEVEAAKGDIQRAEASFNKKKLEDAKFIPLARYVDDVEMNDELRDQERWNDPAAGFLQEKKKKNAGKKSVSGKPLYAGSGPPNRYGIRPGYRWDGVDRGNGFEKKYFAAMNKRKNLKELDYAWQMDE